MTQNPTQDRMKLAREIAESVLGGRYQAMTAENEMTEAERLAECLTSYGNAWLTLDRDIADDFLEAATLLRAQAKRLGELQGLIDAQGVGHVTRTWVNEAGHYCMEVIPDADFFARPVLSGHAKVPLAHAKATTILVPPPPKASAGQG